MSDLIYNKFKIYLGNDTIDMDNDTFKCVLLTSSHVPSAGYEVYSDIANDEVIGDGYTTGGVTLNNATWTESNGVATFDADDALWTNATFTARYAVIYDDTSLLPDNVLLCMFDLGSDQFVNNGSFRIRFNSGGILKLF